MDFSHIQSQTSLNIYLFIKNYLYRHLKQNFNRHKILISINKYNIKRRAALALSAPQISARSVEWFLRYRSLNVPKF